jgi:hypothetical protein
MTINVYLNRSVYSNDNTNAYPQAILAVADGAGPINAAQAFTGVTANVTNPPAGPVAVNLTPWGLGLTQTDTYQDGNLLVAMYTLTDAQWDPLGSLTSPDGFIELTSALNITSPQNPVANPQVLPLRLANPGDFQMLDVKKNPITNTFNPSWLSADTRTFRVKAGTNVAIGQAVTLPFGNVPKTQGTTWNAVDAVAYAKTIKTWLTNNPAQAITLFDSLDANEDNGSLLEERTTELGQGGDPVYNFAIVRVEANNTGAQDLDAQVVLRLFNTLNAGLTYDGFNGPNYPAVPTSATPAQPYPAGWPTPVARVSTVGRLAANADPICMPFYGETRIPAGTAEDQQSDLTNALHIAAAQAGAQTMFGVFHVDINDPTPRYTNGLGNLQTIATLLKNAHVCMVAELISKTDLTPAGASPQSSGNLAQRNLAIGYISNPGRDPVVRTIQHNFEYVPVVHPPVADPADALTHARRAPEGPFRPNELLFLTKNVPKGTVIDLFMPGLNAKKAFHPGARPVAGGEMPAHPVSTEDHAVSFGIKHAVRVPIPVPEGHRYPTLLTVRFPPGLDVGKRYDIDVLQVDPMLGKVVGAFRLSTPVVKARTIVVTEFARADSAMHRASHAKPESPWGAVLARQALFAQAKARSTAIEAAHDAHEGGGRRVRVILDRIEVPIHRKTPRSVTAAVLEGGHRVATEQITIPAGDPGVVKIGKPIFEGAMHDHLMVKLLDQATPGGRMVIHERGWHALGGRPIAHSPDEGGSHDPHESSWKVWFHVETKPHE